MTKSDFLAPIPAPGAARRHLARPTDLSMDLSQGDTFPGNLSLGDTFAGNVSLGDTFPGNLSLGELRVFIEGK